MLGIFSNKQKPAQGTLSADLRAARKSGVRTAILVTLLVSGVTPALLMFWQNGDGLTFAAHLRIMVSVTVQSYPLTLAVAVIVISRQQKWFPARMGRWCFAGSVIVFAATITNFTSQLTGHGFIPPAELMQERSNFIKGIPAIVVNTIGGFYQAYGFGMFAASLLIGSYAGVTASRLLGHVPRSKKQAAQLAAELVRTRNRAA